MPFIQIPTKAHDKYIELCQNVKDSTTESQFNENRIKAQTYSKAIDDICGISVWGSIIRDADTEIGSDDCPTCCGIPIFLKS
jgi:hypothetical protein